ncbi:MAG: hypothetical protein E7643_02800 [Ruminococcaceae bacterium]|nr:hypothetical protein [Oscillospiraceae bacterium]
MKKRVIGRIIALILTLATLASTLSLPAIAADNVGSAEVYASEDFSGALADGTTLDLDSVNLRGAHTYVSVGEKSGNKYALIPYRGAEGEGNWDDSMRLEHRALTAEEDQGVFLEFDVYLHYVPVDPEAENPAVPTVEFQLEGITHDPNSAGQTKSTYISLLKLNVQTGAVVGGNYGVIKDGVAGPKANSWNTIRFELDLISGTYATYVNGNQYAVYGKISSGEAVKNVNIAKNSVLLAKCNKVNGTYADLNDDDEVIKDTDMSYVLIDDVKLYRNANYKMPVVEPTVPYAIFSDTFESKQEGEQPKYFGYKAAPTTATVVKDPTNPDNNAVQVDFKSKSTYKYYFWNTGNSGMVPIKEGEYTIESGVLTTGTVSGPIWGDDEAEKATKPNTAPVSGGTLDSSKTWHIVTGEWADAMHGAGNVGTGLNPAHPDLLSAVHDTVVLNVSYYFSPDAAGKIEIQMQAGIEWAQKDADGNPIYEQGDPVLDEFGEQVYDEEGYPVYEQKLKMATATIWVDTVTVQAKAGEDKLTVANGGNYTYVCGIAPELYKGEWFQMSVVYNMKTGYEDIYFNGSYAYTLKPKAEYNGIPETEFSVYKINANSLNTGKIQRGIYAPSMSGYFLVDNINFSTKEVLQGATYEKKEIWNFDDPAIFDDPDTEDEVETSYRDGVIASNSPASVRLTGANKVQIGVDEDENPIYAPDNALRFTVGESMTEVERNMDVLWSTSKYFEGKRAIQVSEVEYDPDTGLPLKVKVGSNWITGDRGKFDVGDANFKGYELGKYADFVNYWGVTGYGTTAGNATPAANLDKAWTFFNTGISYATKEKLAIDMELYLPAEGAGLIQGRIAKGVGKVADATTLSTFADMVIYTLDVGTGSVYVGGDTETAAGKLVAGEWNVLSCVINMRTGEMEIYSNSIYSGKGNLPYSELAFYENTLVPLIGLSGQEKMAGDILLDDLRFITVAKELVTVDSTLENIKDIKFKGISITDPASLIKEGTRVFVTDDTPYVEEMYDTATYKNVVKSAYNDNVRYTVRLGEHSGLRFCTAVDTKLLEKMKTQYSDKVVFGTLIVPANALDNVDSFTRTELDRSGISYIDVRTSAYYEDFYYDSDAEKLLKDTKVFAGSIVDLAPDEVNNKFADNVASGFAAVGYVEVTLDDGLVVIYSDTATATLALEAQKYLDKVDDISNADLITLRNYARKLLPEG